MSDSDLLAILNKKEKPSKAPAFRETWRLKRPKRLKGLSRDKRSLRLKDVDVKNRFLAQIW